MKLHSLTQTTVMALLALTTASQAAVLTDINGASAAADFSGETFTGPQPFSTTTNNWGYNDNFNNASFAGLTIGLGGNQPFLNATIQNADFSGVTFDYTPFVNSGNVRVNMFRQSAGVGTAYAGADFSNTTFNFTLNQSTLGSGAEIEFFNGGSGATDAASAANAINFSGADFNFSGTGVALNDDIYLLLRDNLGGVDGSTNIGAFYDDTFVTNNFAAFGFASAAALTTDLDTAGWQYSAVPEPSSTALLGLGGIALLLRRSK